MFLRDCGTNKNIYINPGNYVIDRGLVEVSNYFEDFTIYIAGMAALEPSNPSSRPWQHYL
jgi:hypothetical protein